jgi:two-component system, LytTR family, response regulator
MRKMTCLIVEDEENSKVLLTSTLNDFCPQLEIVGYAISVEAGVNQVERLNPDIIFLDIELADGNAFDLLSELGHKEHSIIFTTAYDDFALAAFKCEAVDYLLKPYTPTDIINAVEKVKRRNYSIELLSKLLNVNNKEQQKHKITLSNAAGIVMIEIDKILRIEADRSYCYLYECDGNKMIVSKPMKEIESMLPAESFFRLHDGHIINVEHLRKFSYEDGGIAILNDGTHVPVSRRKKQEFLDFIRK